MSRTKGYEKYFIFCCLTVILTKLFLLIYCAFRQPLSSVLRYVQVHRYHNDSISNRDSLFINNADLHMNKECNLQSNLTHKIIISECQMDGVHSIGLRLDQNF